MSRTRRIAVWVFCLVAPLAVALIALSHPTAGWNCAILTVTAVAPLVCAIAAVFGDRSRAPLRAGFAIGCGSYFLLYFLFGGTGIYSGSGPSSHPNFDSLATTKVIFLLHDNVFFRKSPARLVGSADDGYDHPAPPHQRGSNSGGAFQVPDSNKPTLDLTKSPDTLGDETFTYNQLEDYQEIADRFQQIGHCVWAWIFGAGAGVFAQCLASRRMRERAAVAAPS